jgi:4,5-dihydroxyphthalate decarboxylase
MVVVSKALSNNNPEAVREGFRLLQATATRAPAGAPRFSQDEMRRSLELIIRYTMEQGLIPRAYDVKELFDDVTRPLFEGMP